MNQKKSMTCALMALVAAMQYGCLDKLHYENEPKISSGSNALPEIERKINAPSIFGSQIDSYNEIIESLPNQITNRNENYFAIAETQISQISRSDKSFFIKENILQPGDLALILNDQNHQFGIVSIFAVEQGVVNYEPLLNTDFHPSIYNRVIRVLQPNFSLNGKYFVKPFNGTSGGILAIASNTFDFMSDFEIDASGAGFRGGLLPGQPGEGFGAGSAGGQGGNVGFDPHARNEFASNCTEHRERCNREHDCYTYCIRWERVKIKDCAYSGAGGGGSGGTASGISIGLEQNSKAGAGERKSVGFGNVGANGTIGKALLIENNLFSLFMGSGGGAGGTGGSSSENPSSGCNGGGNGGNGGLGGNGGGAVILISRNSIEAKIKVSGLPGTLGELGREGKTGLTSSNGGRGGEGGHGGDGAAGSIHLISTEPSQCPKKLSYTHGGEGLCKTHTLN